MIKTQCNIQMNEIKKLIEFNYAFLYFVDKLMRRLIVQKNIYKFVEHNLSISRGARKYRVNSGIEDLFVVRLEEDSQMNER